MAISRYNAWRAFTKMVLRAVAPILAAFTVSVFAATQQITVPKGTQVILVFDQDLDSKTAKVGDPVKLHVKDDVVVGGAAVIKKGTLVTGVVSQVEKRKRYGINAKMRVAFNPVGTTYGHTISLASRSLGEAIGGKTGKAAAATAGGAAVLGPVGLVGGYFVRGKGITVKACDQVPTEVARDTTLMRKG